ncbi:hypothetical protein MXB_96, partial [Myxobolus squamalis]
MWHRNKAKRVIFAVDEEKDTEKAFEYFAKCLHEQKDEITLLHVLIPPVRMINYSQTIVTITNDDYTKEAYEKYEQSKKLLESYMTKCKEMNLNCSQEIVSMKDRKVSDSICSYAKDKADVIVMSSGKHSIMEKLLLGSITTNTIQKSSVPVM